MKITFVSRSFCSQNNWKWFFYCPKCHMRGFYSAIDCRTEYAGHAWQDTTPNVAPALFTLSPISPFPLFQHRWRLLTAIKSYICLRTTMCHVQECRIAFAEFEKAKEKIQNTRRAYFIASSTLCIMNVDISNCLPRHERKVKRKHIHMRARTHSQETL